jgi:hypothetical protein
MAKPHESLDQGALHEYPMVKELLAELPEIDDKTRVERRFYEITA